MKAIGVVTLEGTLLAGGAPADPLFYVGTYTSNGKSRGIYLCRLRMATGEVVIEGLAGEATNPSFLAVDRRAGFLYAVNEVNELNGQPGGGVTAFAIDAKTGMLTRLNQRSTRGTSPCYVTVHPKGRHIVVANYGGGNVAVLPIGADGSLGEATDLIQHTGSGANPQRQQGPRAHCVVVAPGGRRVLAVDLGIDKVMIYEWDGRAGRLLPGGPGGQASLATRPGAGPRHLDFAPRGNHAYLINELDSTLTACAWDKTKGMLTALQTVPSLPSGFTGSNTCADVHVHPSGRYVYGSNRGHDSIVAFRIDQTTGRLDYLAHESTRGRNPRNFAIDPSGRYLLAANQASDSIVSFRIDSASGRLAHTGHEVSIPMPVCVRFAG